MLLSSNPDNISKLKVFSMLKSSSWNFLFMHHFIYSTVQRLKVFSYSSMQQPFYMHYLSTEHHLTYDKHSIYMRQICGIICMVF